MSFPRQSLQIPTDGSVPGRTVHFALAVGADDEANYTGP